MTAEVVTFGIAKEDVAKAFPEVFETAVFGVVANAVISNCSVVTVTSFQSAHAGAVAYLTVKSTKYSVFAWSEP